MLARKPTGGFMPQVGSTPQPKCKACGGSGKSSKGYVCYPCKGTGKLQRSK